MKEIKLYWAKAVIKIVLLHLSETRTSDSLALKQSPLEEERTFLQARRQLCRHSGPRSRCGYRGNETTNVISRSRDGMENRNRLVRVNLICSVTLRSLGHKHMLTNCCLDKQINTEFGAREAGHGGLTVGERRRSAGALDTLPD